MLIGCLVEKVMKKTARTKTAMLGLGLLLSSSCAGKWDFPHKPKIQNYRPSIEVIAEEFGGTLDDGTFLPPFQIEGLSFKVGKKITNVGDGKNQYGLSRLTVDITEPGKPYPLLRIKNASPYSTLNINYNIFLSEGREPDSILACNEEMVCKNIEADNDVLDFYETGLEGAYYSLNKWKYKVPEGLNLSSSFRTLTNF